MFDHRDFQQVFPAGAQLPYDTQLRKDIDESRKTFDGLLFIDRVTQALGLPDKAYPPKSDGALTQLHRLICDASIPLHHKFSLLYYILLDFDEANPRANAAEGFASASGMPRNYQIFMKGLWYLDQQDFTQALEYVTHPSLIADFADDILVALIRHGKDYTLGLSYYHTVQPILKTSKALELVFEALAHTSILEALLFSRTYPDSAREVLFHRLIKISLDEKKPADSTEELAFLPLEAAEETWFAEYLSYGEGKSLRRAKDTLLIRRIANNKFVEVGQHKSTGNWAPILEGIRAGTENHGA